MGMMTVAQVRPIYGGVNAKYSNFDSSLATAGAGFGFDMADRQVFGTGIPCFSGNTSGRALAGLCRGYGGFPVRLSVGRVITKSPP